MIYRLGMRVLFALVASLAVALLWAGISLLRLWWGS